MSEHEDAILETPAPEFLVGVRLREGDRADDYRVTGDLDLHVGDLVIVTSADGETMGEVRRPRRPLPDFKRDRVYPGLLRLATGDEVEQWRERREREKRAIGTCQERAHDRGLPMKVVDVEMHPTARRVTVHFNAEDRVDFRELVRDLAREFRARIEMRQIGARDVTRVMDGIGPCGRQLCCSSHLRKFEPISVKMAKTQDMPLTDSRLLGNCGRLKCCLLYEFSLYEELRSRLPRVNTPCQASCGGGGCMSGKVRSLRVLKQSVLVGFPDGTEAEVPLDQLTWEGRAHIDLGAQPQPAVTAPGEAPQQGRRGPDRGRQGAEQGRPGQGQARGPGAPDRPSSGQRGPGPRGPEPRAEDRPPRSRPRRRGRDGRQKPDGPSPEDRRS
jgi:cell fate regulator YaaT (PSP1 superfamily)